jgi:hypothetical protein
MTDAARELALIPAVLAAMIATGAAWAAEGIPLPQPRPGAPEAAPVAGDDVPETAPLLKDKPSEVAPPPPQAQPDSAPAQIDAAAETACRRRLQQLGVAFDEMAPIEGEGACGVAAPIRVSGLGRGISLAPPATLNCRMAVALALWAQETLLPAAERHLQAAPSGLVNAASYVCRSRNSQPGAKLSEHATANAIDIAGFAFAEDEPMPVVARSDEEARERAFQRAVRRGACEHFTTVLGPGSDAAHATHFHLDLAQRRGGYRLCQ